MSEITAAIERLKTEASTCERCELSHTRTNVVFGEGNPDTPLLIIGEGPGANEDATGRPFVGRAGNLLDQALEEAGMTRKHIYITNVVKCRASITENGSTRNRPPATSEITACTPWLEQQIATIKPLVILCLGAPSANFIIHNNFKMTQERGQFFDTRFGCYGIAALHPAYVLRQVGEMFEQMRAFLVADIIAARKKVIEAKKEPPKRLL